MKIGVEQTEDTGWITLNSTYGAEYRVKNGVVFVNVIYNGNIPGDTNLGTLPEQYRPKRMLRFSNYNQGSFANAISLQIRADGMVSIIGSGDKWINVTGSYPI